MSRASNTFCATCRILAAAWYDCWYCMSLAASSSRFTPAWLERAVSALVACALDASEAVLAVCTLVPICAMAAHRHR